MAREPGGRIDSADRRWSSFRQRRATLFNMAWALSEEFAAHVAVVAFSPAGDAYAFGAPTVDCVLRTYLPAADGAPRHPAFPSSDAAASGAETLGEAAARLSGMRRDREDTKALVAKEWAQVVATREKVGAALTAAQMNWWEVDVEALGEKDLPVFIRSLEMLKADVKGRLGLNAVQELG